jgi:acyl-CoA dehydrogenase
MDAVVDREDAEVLALDGEFRLGVRRLVEGELEPLVAEIDRTGMVPDRAITILRDNGFLGLRIAPEFGGGGMGLLPYLVMVEELSRSHRVFTLIVEGTSGLGAIGLERYGTPEQRSKYLEGVATGRLGTAFALTEPGAGSDASAISTRARPGLDGGWVLNGRKHYINGGHTADLLMVVAVTDPDKRARGGITAFLVEKGTPGFSVTRVDTTIGSEAIKLAEISFDDCALPETSVLGGVGNGFKVAMSTLADGRLAVSFASVGIAERLLGMMVEHARERQTFGAPLATRQAIQWLIADSATELAAARALVYGVAQRLVEGERNDAETSMAKLFASEMVGRVADRAVQVFGGAGLVRGFPVERFYRDVRHYRVGEGASEIHRMLIARQVLGLDAKGNVR